jgi:hypothetical protein
MPAGMAGMARAVLRRQRLANPAKAGYDLDQPAFNRKRLKAEKLIDSKVLEQPASK